MRARIVVALLCAGVAGLDASQQRDTPLTPTSGTSAIAGQVLSDETTPRPVRRAIVTVAGDLPAARSAITDDDGRFTFRNLPAGLFTINVTKVAYLPASYGALRPGRAGTPLQIAQGEQAAITIRMARGGVIAGTLMDRNGAPIAGVAVTAAPGRTVLATGPPGQPGTATEASATTDDRGMYRLFGLAPGEYLISATPRIGGSGAIGIRSTTEVDALFAELMMRGRAAGGSLGSAAAAPARVAPAIPDPPSVGFAAIYYPGTPFPKEAAPIKIAAGEERTGMDFTLAPVRTSILEGQISGPIPNLAVAQLIINIGGRRGVSSADLNPVLSLSPGPAGSFRFTNVSPGHYTLMARADRNQSAPLPPSTGSSAGTRDVGPGQAAAGRVDYLYAVVDLDVRGEDMTGINLALQPGSTFAGKIRFDGLTLPPPVDLTALRVGLAPPGGSYYMSSGSTIIGNIFNSVPAFTIGPDGSFTGSNIAPGSYTLTAAPPGGTQPGWWLRSAITKGRDLLDGPLQIVLGENFSDVVLTFSDQHSELSGALQSSAGGAAPEYFVVVFPEDRALWSPNARRIQTTRPATNGNFSLRDLPAGDYLMAALIDLEPGDLNDPKFLEALVSGAIRLRLADGEKKQQDIRVLR